MNPKRIPPRVSWEQAVWAGRGTRWLDGWLSELRVPPWSPMLSMGMAPATRPLCSSLPQVDPYLPYEYTCMGMLERIHAYIQHQVGHPASSAPGT